MYIYKIRIDSDPASGKAPPERESAGIEKTSQGADSCQITDSRSHTFAKDHLSLSPNFHEKKKNLFSLVAATH